MSSNSSPNYIRYILLGGVATAIGSLIVYFSYKADKKAKKLLEEEKKVEQYLESQFNDKKNEILKHIERSDWNNFNGKQLKNYFSKVSTTLK